MRATLSREIESGAGKFGESRVGLPLFVCISWTGGGTTGAKAHGQTDRVTRR
jgi:hypothetical protein